MKPREPGHSAIVDTAKVCAIGALSIGQRLRSAVPGAKQDVDDAARYLSGPPGARRLRVSGSGLPPGNGRSAEPNAPDRSLPSLGRRRPRDAAELTHDPLARD